MNYCDYIQCIHKKFCKTGSRSNSSVHLIYRFSLRKSFTIQFFWNLLSKANPSFFHIKSLVSISSYCFHHQRLTMHTSFNFRLLKIHYIQIIFLLLCLQAQQLKTVLKFENIFSHKPNDLKHLNQIQFSSFFSHLQQNSYLTIQNHI